MPRTRECDFCGGDIEPGTGTMFVSTDGTTTHFCSSKCESNADLGRKARDLEWTDTARPGTTEQEPAGEPDAAAQEDTGDADTTGDGDETDEQEEAEA